MFSIRETNFFKDWTQICSIIICTIPLLNEGLLFSWPSPAIIILTNSNRTVSITHEEASYFTVIPSIVYIITAIPIGWIVNHIGRRNTLMLATIPYMISGLLLGLDGSKWVYYTGRLVQGISTSSTYCASPLYCGEVAVPNIRGKWGNLMAIQYFLGILIMLTVGSYLNLLGIAAVCIAVPIINLLLLLCIPESPYYLVMKEKHKEAKFSLQWLRQSEDVDEEMGDITNTVQKQLETTGTFKDVFLVQANRKALIAMIVVRLAQQLSGISALLTYSHTFFTMTGGDLSPSTCAIISGAAQVVFSIIGAMLVNKYSRRSTLFASGIATIGLLLVMALYFVIDGTTNIDLSSLSWFPIVGMVLYLFAYSMGLSTVPMILGSELFATSVKEKSIALHNIVFGILIATTTKLFQYLAQFGLYLPLFFFALLCASQTLATYFVLPETKGRTLEEIQVELNKTTQ